MDAVEFPVDMDRPSFVYSTREPDWKIGYRAGFFEAGKRDTHDVGALSPCRGNTPVYIEGYSQGYEESCRFLSETPGHSLWDHQELEKAIYECSAQLGIAKMELQRAQGANRVLTLRDTSYGLGFVTFAGRDAMLASKHATPGDA